MWTIDVDAETPAAPVVSSSTHPSQSTWYADDDPAFSWTAPSSTSGIDGYSYILDQTSNTIPDTTSEGTGTTKNYTDAGTNTWYFHCRARNAVGTWGLTAHYTININFAPNTPTCSSPISSAEVSSDTPTLQWNAFSDTDAGDTQGGWEIQIDTEDDWDGTYVQEPSADNTNNSYALTTPLLAADIYYWRVRVKDNHSEWSSWSSSASFRQLHVYVDDSAAGGGNGTSTSKYQLINEAIDNKVTANYTYSVHVAAGTYNEQVDLDGKNAKIYGAGEATTIVDGQSTRSYCIYIHHSSTTSASLVDGITFQNATTDGARIQSGTGIQFTNCTFTNNGYRGIYILTSTTTSTFTGCTISNNCTVSLQDGIRIDSGAAVVIDDCNIYGNTNYQIRAYYGNWVIKNSYIHDGGYAGMLLYYRDTTKPGVVKDNIIVKNRYYGIMMYYNCNAIIWNNVCGGGGNNSHAFFYNWSGVEGQIIGNKVVGQQGYGYMGYARDNSLIANNTFYGNVYQALYWDFESKPIAYNNNVVNNNNWGFYKNISNTNTDEDIQYNNVWNNASGTYSTYCQNSNGISSDPLFTVSASGTSTSLTASTLTDTTKSWTTDQWKGYILIPNTGNRRRAYIIVSNTATVLTVGSYSTSYEITDYATASDSYEITDLSLQGGSPNINAGHTANRFSDTYGSYDRNDIGSTGGYGPVPRTNPYDVSACINSTGVQLNAQYHQTHPDKTATFSWAQTGGTSVTLSSTTAEAPTFTAPASAQTLTFTVTVNDGYADGEAHTAYAYINPYVTVNGAGSYTSIASAISAASNTDTVNIPAGRFMETVDPAGKAITVDGADNYASIIDGDNRISQGVYIHSNETSSTIIQDLQIQNQYREGIYVYDSDPVDSASPLIQNNYLHHGWRSIYIYRSSPTFKGNYIVKTIEGQPLLIGDGCAATFEKNYFSGNRVYIYVYPNNASYTTTFKNNIVAGQKSYGFYIRYANTKFNMYNNTIYGNSSYGLRVNAATAANIVMKNNIIANNYSYGIYCYNGGGVTNTYNDVWNNSSADYSGCSAGTGDISSDPKFVIDDSGTSTGASYTTLTDTSKSWTTNEWRGYYLIPDTNDKYCFMIWSNTSDTLTVMDIYNMDWTAPAGSSYQITSLKLQKPSPCIDVGTNTDAPSDDFWDDTRPYDNGFAYYSNVADMGCDETSYSLSGKPTIGTPSALSTTSIRWNFTDTATEELGFKVHDASHTVVASDATANLSYIDETGLSPNTQYTRHAIAYNETVIPNSPNANGESDDSGGATIYTLASPSDAASTESASTWYQGAIGTEKFNFTSATLGVGIQYYRYVWDKVANDGTTVTGSDTQWTSDTLQLTPSNSKNMWLHILPYNGDNVAGTQDDLGPFYFVDTERLLRGGKFFTDDGELIEQGPKTP